jgi:hypothetical protein
VTAVWNIGDRVALTYTAQVNDVPTAATVVLTVTDPEGVVTTPSVGSTSTGVYTANVDVAAAGIWTFRWVASGAVVDAEDGTFRVRASLATGSAYATVAELREQFRDDDSVLDDKQLQRALNAASRAVDDYCCRRFWRDTATSTRTYRVNDPVVAWVDDISTTTGLIVQTDPSGGGTWSQTWTTADYQLEPSNAAGDAAAYAWWRIQATSTLTFPWLDRQDALRVTARWGWSAVPDPVVEATILKAAALFKRKDAPFGVLGFSDIAVVRIGRQDPDVVALLRPYVKVTPTTLDLDPQYHSMFHGGRR